MVLTDGDGGTSSNNDTTMTVATVNDAPTFTPIGTSAQAATIAITADNVYNLYVNGVLVGTHSDWVDIETYTSTLQIGDVVAIEGIDMGGAAAMIAAIDFANGARVVTGADWRISTTLQSGWNTQGFDDSQWQNATAHGDRTSAPWAVSISTDTDYGRLVSANWIWASDINSINQVFFRYVVSDSPAVSENAANGTAVVRAVANDVDTGDTLTYSIQSQEYAGAFVINATTGMITVNNSSLLNFESDTNHTVLVRATDTGGLFSERTITIALRNVNESPSAAVDSATAVEAGGVGNGTAGTNPTGNVVTNDTDVDAGDTKTVTGVVAGTAGSASGSVGSSVSGTYGSIQIASNGSYTYTVDNSNAAVQALRTSANTLQDVFTYTMTDAGGLTSTTEITVTIQGDNDAPVGVNDTATAVEAGGTANGTAGTNPTGNVLTNDTDVDLGDTKTVTGVVAGSQSSASGGVATSVMGSYGSISIAADGSYTYAVDNSNASVQALRTSGNTIQDVFTYKVADTAGLTSLATITVTIQGANDAPLGVNDTATAVEAGGVSNGTAGTNPTGNVLTNDTDVDSGDSKSVTAVVAGAQATATGGVASAVTGFYGSINLAADGSFTYTVDNTNATVQSLRTSGNTLQDLFTYKVADAGGLTSLATITITIQGANDAPYDVTAGTLSVNENASNGSSVGTVAGLDVDSGESFTYSLIDSAAGRFAINNAGLITVADGGLLNREAIASHSITVRVTDAGGAFYDKSFTIGVNDVDEFDVIAPTDGNNTANAVTENSANGTLVGITVSAVDTDASNNTVTYSLFNSAGGRFTIDANTGVVTVADGSLLDREVAASYDIVVRATSSDGSTADTIFTVNLNDIDEFDVGVVSDTNATTNAVNENASIGTVVGITASASDADATINAITYSLFDNDGGRFAIDSSTGVVTVAGAINLETDGASRSIIVRATSADGSYTDQSFSIVINDVDEFNVGVVSDTNATANAVNENASIGTVVGITASASDADATINAITYSLFDNDGGRFAISSSTGVVTVAGAINLETDGASRTIIVRATSADGSYTDQSFSIVINDVDEFDVGVVSDTNVTANAVNENASIGSLVGITASGIDADATTNAITYSLFDNDGGRFAINSSTGVVTVAGAINLETDGASRTIIVRATSADGSYTVQSFSITINDIDEFDVGAVTDTNATANAVNENASIGTVVGITASASDADATINAITYSLFDNDGGRFAINSSTGVVTVAGAINLETDGASRSIIVRATSLDGSYTNQSFSILINDIDEFDVGSVSDSNVAVNVVNEFAANGSVVGLTALAIDSDATTNAVTYTLDNSAGGRFAINSSNGIVTVADGSLLDAAQANSHDITIRATSADGSFNTQIFTILVSNLNDAPTAVADTAIALEAGGIANGTSGTSPSGNVLTNDTDPDVGDSHSVIGVAVGIQSSASGSVGSSVTGSYGSITINADGAYSYTVNNSSAAVQALRTSSHTLQDVFTYSQQDAGGLSSTTQLTITIQGQNDVPHDLTSGTLAVNENASNGAVVGAISGHDMDSGDTLTYSLTDSAGGRFAINSTTGQVTVADGSLLNFEAAQSHNITVRVTDTAGTTYDEQFTINLNGVNETPVAVSDANTAVEAGGVANATSGTNPSGNVLSNDTDVDAGDTKTIAGVAAGVQASATGGVATSVTGTYGAIFLLADGSYTYTVDNSNAAVQALRTTANTLQDVFTYTMVDSGGLTSTTQITLTIQGANDNPVAVSDSTVAVEAGGYSNGTSGSNPTGNVLANDTDVDAGDTKTVSGLVAGTSASAVGSVGTAVTGSYGSITINSDGSYSYTVDNNNATVQALRTASDTITDVFSYTVTDTAGTTSTTQITVTIQGRNDAPGAVDDTPIAVEAGGVSNGSAGTNPTGNLLSNDTDVDSGDSKTVSGVVAGTAASAVGSVGTAVTGSYGSITVNSDGSYSYIVDNSNAAVQALRTTSNTLQDVFSYTMIDSGGLNSTTQITITIQGQNDTPVGVGDTASATEAGGVANGTAGIDPSGNVLSNDTDVDAGDSKTVVGVVAGTQASAAGSVGTSVTGNFGSITIAANGSYTYTVDNSNSTVQALRTAADTLTDTFTYSFIDASGAQSTAQIIVTIHGADDTAVPTDDSGNAVEAGGVNNTTVGSNATGNVLSNDSDVDAGDTQTVVGVAAGSLASAAGSVGSSVTGLYGAVTINADGSYTYVVNEANSTVQALRTSGQTISEVFTYTQQGTGGLQTTAYLTITIAGSNDNPVGVIDTANATEAGGLNNGSAGVNPSGNVLTSDTDVDAGDSKTLTGVVAGPSASAVGSVGTAVTGSYGEITINADGSYSYVVDNSNAAVQALRTSGQTLSDVFSYTVTDTDGLASTTQITVTVRGANDTPTANSDSGLATEAGGVGNGTAGSSASGNVLSNDTDVDSSANGETKAVSGVVAGPSASAVGSVGSSVAGNYGSVTINSNGSYVYNVDNTNAAVQALRTSGDTLQDVFTYTMTDAGGLTSTTQLTITIQGQNDNPVAVGDTAIAIEAGGVANGTAGSSASGNVLNNDTDVDAVAGGETKAVSGVVAGTSASAVGSVGSSVTGNYGSITINADGSYSYNIDNNNTAVQALRTFASTLSDVFSYTVTDTAGATSTTQITVTIHGQNDTPHDITASTLVVAENAANGTSVATVLGHDVDSGETFGYSLMDDAGGRFTINTSTGQVVVADGTLLNFENLASHSITVRVTDASGAFFDKQFTVSVTDVNEFTVTAPVDANVTANFVNENAANGTLVGITASAVDADATTNTVSYSLVNSAGGRFAIDAVTGVVTVADGSLLDREAAASHTITVRATSVDGSTANTNFTINLGDIDEFDATAPTDNNAALNIVAENSANGTLVGITATAADLDATSNTISYSLVDSAGGRFAINAATGVVTVANGALLNFEAATSHSITVRATSSDGSTADSVFSIAVTNVNEAPIFTTTTLTTNSITSISLSAPGLLAQAADPENDALSVTLISAPSSGSLTVLADGTLIYTPDVLFYGTLTFVAQVSDGVFQVQTTFTIQVDQAFVPLLHRHHLHRRMTMEVEAEMDRVTNQGREQ